MPDETPTGNDLERSVTDPRDPGKFQIQRRRLGRVKYVEESGKFGFIEAEDFREDVFFHSTAWDNENVKHVLPRVDLFVEFELDESHRTATGKLRASVVRPTERPEGKQLDENADRRLVAQHHPRARQKRPSWRNKD